MAPANAYQTANTDGPLIIITAALLQGTRNNDDELAFVMGHEAGHHIANHLEKRAGQQLAGALILGMATAYAGSGSVDYQNQRNIEDAMDAGAAIGGIAYSQTYELEADMLGAYIAEAAGYDAEKGWLIFARRAGGNTGSTPGVNRRHVALVNAPGARRSGSPPCAMPWRTRGPRGLPARRCVRNGRPSSSVQHRSIDRRTDPQRASPPFRAAIFF